MTTKPWITNYPSSLDTVASHPIVVNDVDTISASHFNSLSQAARELESQVGSDLLETGSLRAQVASNTSNILTNATNTSSLSTQIDAFFTSETGITAYAGGGQANATEITSLFARIATCATDYDSLRLPAATVGQVFSIYNGANKVCAVYPQSGGKIDSLATDGYYTLSSWATQEFIMASPTQWYTLNKAYRFIYRAASLTPDFTKTSFTALKAGETKTGDLDISAIVPPGCKGISFSFSPIVMNTGSSFWIYGKGNSSWSGMRHIQCVNYMWMYYNKCFVPLNSSYTQTLRYTGQTILSYGDMRIHGWWIEG